MSLTIEITSDFICPWCYVAEARLKKVLTQLAPNVRINWVWRPFELNPDMPPAGIDRKHYRAHKFGSWEYSQTLDTKTVQATQNDDIEFRYDLMTITPNTLKAHRLVWLAAERATAMAERIFRAYFSEGQDITNSDVLAELATDVGLEKDTVLAFLDSDAGVEDVQQLEQQARADRVQGVPHIRIGEQVLSGAQPLEVFFTAVKDAVQLQSM